MKDFYIPSKKMCFFSIIAALVSVLVSLWCMYEALDHSDLNLFIANLGNTLWAGTSIFAFLQVIRLIKILNRLQ